MKILFIIILLTFNIFAKEIDFKISYDPDYAPFSYKQASLIWALIFPF